ncbi:conserved hypothetical protein, partial [Ricinus communis]
MKRLAKVTATAEQLPLISQNRPGVEVIRGAAGSGKTTTALLRLHSLCAHYHARLEREPTPRPVRVLVLTFNRTLAGYVSALADRQINDFLNVEIEINTFGGWAKAHAGNSKTILEHLLGSHTRSLSHAFPAYSTDFLINEVEYLLGRFEPEDIESYVAEERTGRGTLPRVERTTRRRILDSIVYPYLERLEKAGGIDWNQLAISMARTDFSLNYDVLISDESQDFSANQLRAMRHHLGNDFAATFVIDTAQR